MRTLTALSLLFCLVTACVPPLPEVVPYQPPTIAVCGDAIVGTGEACDDGDTINTNACTNDCRSNVCGDGILHVGVEECDDGTDENGQPHDDDACLNTCLEARCGDGVQRVDLQVEEAGYEACDDGNRDNTDDCVGDCLVAACGDGFVHDGQEACDDNNSVNTDACTAACEAARCGDGFVRDDLSEGEAGYEDCEGPAPCGDDCRTTCGNGRVDPGEDCDDGNRADGDACPANCQIVICGDGEVEGDEECEDGNENEDDDCRNCRLPACGDGVLDHALGEECDGDQDLGTCDATCHPKLVQLAVGGNFICALRADSTVICWGANHYGQTGTGPTVGSTRKIADRDPLGFSIGVINGRALAVGEFHSCGLVTWPVVALPPDQVDPEGSVIHCWGSNQYGQLGRETNMTPNLIPQPVDHEPDLPQAPIKDLSAQRSTTCFIDAQQRLFCAGLNGDLRLHGVANERGYLDQPVLIYAEEAVGKVANGRHHQCFTYTVGMENEVVACWGLNGHGQLGNGSSDAQPVHMPVLVDGIAGNELYVRLVAGQYHSCVVNYPGTIRCWGSNLFGQVGTNPEDGDEVTRATQVDRLASMQGVVAGENATCAWHKDRGVFCWGDLGFTTSPNAENVSYRPQQIEGLPAGEVPEDVALGVNGQLCILMESGRLFCRGANVPVGLLSHTDQAFFDELVELTPWLSED